MKILSRLRSFLQTVPSRIVGSYVDNSDLVCVGLSTKAVFEPSDKLEQRMRAARAECRAEVKPLRRRR